MKRPLVLLALIWATFLVFVAFATIGDTSLLHISAHVCQLPLLAFAAIAAWRFRTAAMTRTQRALGWILSVAVPLALVGIALELAAAVVRLAQDGWVNQATPEIWESGLHLWAANLAVPLLMLSMLTTLILVLASAIQGRRRLESVT